jgi:hypothetical protein
MMTIICALYNMSMRPAFRRRNAREEEAISQYIHSAAVIVSKAMSQTRNSFRPAQQRRVVRKKEGTGWAWNKTSVKCRTKSPTLSKVA